MVVPAKAGTPLRLFVRTFYFKLGPRFRGDDCLGLL